LILRPPDDADTAKAIDKYSARQVAAGKLGVTVYFSGAGTTTGSVKFAILG